MAQINIPLPGAAGVVVTPADTLVVPNGDIEAHPLTVVGAGAATVTITRPTGGYLHLNTTANITVSRS